MGSGALGDQVVPHQSWPGAAFCAGNSDSNISVVMASKHQMLERERNSRNKRGVMPLVRIDWELDDIGDGENRRSSLR